MRKKRDPKAITGLLGVGSIFHGRIGFEGTLRIDGSVYGEIFCENDAFSTVVVTQGAEVEADIVADIVVVSGKVWGNVKAIERLELHREGQIEGLVYTSDFHIKDGALFQGECIMIRDWSAEKKRMLKLERFYGIHAKERTADNPRIGEKGEGVEESFLQSIS